MSHIPVLIDEILEILKKSYKAEGDKQVFVDGTFGAGGYSRKILSNFSNSNLYALDRDPDVTDFAKNLEQDFATRFFFIKGNFKDMDDLLQSHYGITQVDAVVLDLGVSSMQLDSEDRGFSFAKNAFLDMRMEKRGLTAFDVVNNFSEQELCEIIYNYGEESEAKRIAKAIILSRQNKAIENSKELSAIIQKAKIKDKYKKIDCSTKTFQAIRIVVNDELGSLTTGLEKIAKILKKGGIIIIVSFHSLEDKIVKEFLLGKKEKQYESRHMPSYLVRQDEQQKKNLFSVINKKVICPSEEEIKRNPRSRSAKLRWAIRSEYSLEEVGV